MNYKETLEYIHSTNWCFCKPGLERIGALCAALGNPQKSLKFVHVAGTNGKGSFCSMLASILQKSGLRVGLFTSPYIRTFNERMQVSGVPISDEVLAKITTKVRPVADSLDDKPTEFELITAVGFEYFSEMGCDVVVLETGMGGRLDASNIIDTSLLSVITGISLDHVAYLGDTVEKIAAEKAGIIKRGCPVLFGGTDKSAERVIRDKAAEQESELFLTDYSQLIVKNATLEGCEFDFADFKDMHINLLGLYQSRNAASVLSAVRLLRRGGLQIPDSAVREGLLAARWQARFEIIDREPLTIFDGAHNAEGIESAVQSIVHYFGEQRVYVLSGVLADKDYKFIAKKISTVAKSVYTITPDNPRALAASDYAAELEKCGARAVPYETLKCALTAAKEQARRDGVPLLVLGSLYTYCQVVGS